MKFPHPGGPLLPMRARVMLPAALLASSFGARAQGVADFPNKPVRWIVPVSAGAGTDAAARAFARVTGEAWKQSVVVDNRSGASGMIGLEMVNDAAPDGYTLGFISVSQFIDATLSNKYSFDAQKDLTPISMLALTPLLLIVNGNAKIESVAQLIAVAKAQPKVLNYSSGGSGGVTHFAMEMFLKRAGIEVTHVPYKGTSPAILGLLSGHVQLAFSTPAAVMPHVKTGRLRALAIASPARSFLTPEVPTFAEQGLSGLSLTIWYGLIGPANMPAPLVDKIARTVAAAAQPASVRDKMMGEGFEPVLTMPGDFTTFLRAEREQWMAVAKAINFKRES